LARLLKAAPRHLHLKLIVVIDKLEPEAKRLAEVWSQAQGVKLEELSECRSWFVVCLALSTSRNNLVEDYGKQHRRDIIRPSPSDLATICYTSVSSIQVCHDISVELT
jgi:hypothetical protein